MYLHVSYYMMRKAKKSFATWWIRIASCFSYRTVDQFWLLHWCRRGNRPPPGWSGKNQIPKKSTPRYMQKYLNISKRWPDEGQTLPMILEILNEDCPHVCNQGLGVRSFYRMERNLPLFLRITTQKPRQTMRFPLSLFEDITKNKVVLLTYTIYHSIVWHNTCCFRLLTASLYCIDWSMLHIERTYQRKRSVYLTNTWGEGVWNERYS